MEFADLSPADSRNRPRGAADGESTPVEGWAPAVWLSAVEDTWVAAGGGIALAGVSNSVDSHKHVAQADGLCWVFRVAIGP